jgi:hypothetical protein
MNAAFMSLELHERGSHVVGSDAGEASVTAQAWPCLTRGSLVLVTAKLSQGSIPFARGEEK